MKYNVTVHESNIWVNGFYASNINDGYRLVAQTYDGHIIKSDFVGAPVKMGYQTQRELDLYKKIIRPGDLTYFPKLISSGKYIVSGQQFVWLIQEKISFDWTAKITKKIKQIIERLEIDYEIDDLQGATVGKVVEECGNWGICNKNPIIYDFGYSNTDERTCIQY